MATIPKSIYITTPEQWECLRPYITKLHEEDNLTVKDIITRVKEEMHFKTTPAMLRTQLTEWGLVKTLRGHEVKKILQVKSVRENLGLETEFFLRGKKVDMARVEKHRSRSKKNMDITGDSLSLASILEKTADLDWRTPPASPSPGAADLVMTPSSSSSLSLEMIPTLPRPIALPTGLRNLQAFLQDTSLMFSAFVPSKEWKLSKSTEMPFSPTTLGPVKNPVIPVWHWQDECLTHLNNGIIIHKKQNGFNAFREWKEAFSLLPSVVVASHNNTVGKMLSCVHLLEQQGHRELSRQFRLALARCARENLMPGHPYQDIFTRLACVETECLENVEELQMRTQKFLVEQLDMHLGEDAFTSFEHRLVLNEAILVKDPSLPIDSLIPTNEECCRKFGPASSKTMLALNMRIGILKHRGHLEEAHQTCSQLIENASTVPDLAVRGWHLASAYMALARMQSNPSEHKAQVSNLEKAWTAELELRTNHGVCKLGTGDMNWIAEIMGMEPVYSATETLGLEAMSLA